jgi:Domain of unknown function (DUF4260)
MIASAMPATTTTAEAVVPSTRSWLRLEAVAAFVAGLVLYGVQGGPWLLIVPLLLVPDVSMIGYLRDARLGAFTYNLVHNWALGLAVLGIGAWTGTGWVVLAGAVLIAHVGMDRALGYGLKGTSFQDTHLGRIGRHREAAAQS